LSLPLLRLYSWLNRGATSTSPGLPVDFDVDVSTRCFGLVHDLGFNPVHRHNSRARRVYDEARQRRPVLRLQPFLVSALLSGGGCAHLSLLRRRPAAAAEEDEEAAAPSARLRLPAAAALLTFPPPPPSPSSDTAPVSFFSATLVPL
ncbi:unnamed protein product, partial [Ectocarpus sp. 12 AP-2014]